MRKVVILLALLALGGPVSSTAQAHTLHQRHGESNYKFASRVVHHAETGIQFIKKHPVKYHTYKKYRQALRNHRWLLSYGETLEIRFQYEATPPHEDAWLCIHRYEGSWTDSGAPYYGGLQMDWNFMSAYGGSLLRSKGTADHWSPREQMWVAEKALQAGRGFHPWPHTAPMCGLL